MDLLYRGGSLVGAMLAGDTSNNERLTMGGCGASKSERTFHAPRCNGHLKALPRGTSACVIVPSVLAGYKGRCERTSVAAHSFMLPQSLAQERGQRVRGVSYTICVRAEV